VTEANFSERKGGVVLVSEGQEKISKLQVIWVDQGYSGKKFAQMIALVSQARVEGIEKKKKQFEVLPRRWVVERTFAWLVQNRRLIVDQEQLPEISEAMIYTAMCCLMLRRLARLAQSS